MSKLIASIQKHHKVKVTDTLVEAYQDLIDSKEFSTDPVLMESRLSDPSLNLLEDKVDFILEDGSYVAIDPKTFQKLNIIDSNISVNDLLTICKKIVEDKE